MRGIITPQWHTNDAGRSPCVSQNRRRCGWCHRTSPVIMNGPERFIGPRHLLMNAALVHSKRHVISVPHQS